jgi:hypothetical protein
LYVELIYKNNLKEIREKIGNSDVNFIIDETTDPCGRFVINILVKALDGKKGAPMLLHVNFIEATDSGSIKREFLNACNKLWPDEIPQNKRVIVTTIKLHIY